MARTLYLWCFSLWPMPVSHRATTTTAFCTSQRCARAPWGASAFVSRARGHSADETHAQQEQQLVTRAHVASVVAPLAPAAQHSASAARGAARRRLRARRHARLGRSVVCAFEAKGERRVRGALLEEVGANAAQHLGDVLTAARAARG